MTFQYREDGTTRPDGVPTPAYGFVCNGTFVVNPYRSECGRFEVNPEVQYGLSNDDANRLLAINRGLGVEC